ncbi:MAG: hypothetical protein IIA45_06385 [Bacteroidetes bacterium]|nr:hypothetical protein [Bacteroidota bacterium]
MRKALLILLLPVLFNSCEKDKSIIPVTYAFDDWIIIEREMPYNINVVDLHFIHEDLGFLISRDSHIIKVVDNGKHWIMQASYSDYKLRSVFFLDENIGFVAGHKPVDYTQLDSTNQFILLKTTDGGVNWVQYYVPFMIRSLQFLDQMLGYAIIQHWHGTPRTYVAKTTDGGLTWQEIHGADYNSVPSLHFSSPNRGIVTDIDGKVYKTENQGDDWSMIVESGTGAYLSNVYFLDKNIGFVRSRHNLYKTIDGGVNWIILDNPFSERELMDFSDRNNGLAIKDSLTYDVNYFEFEGAFIFSTNNGGESWKKSKLLRDLHITKFAYPSSSRAYGYGLGKWYRFDSI